MRSSGARPGSTTSRAVLPESFTDLPSAIAAAESQGMQLPVKSAMLYLAQPRGKTPIAVWSLHPQNDPRGKVENCFIAAEARPCPLELSDVSDLASSYNAEWQHIIDQFHAAAAAKDNASNRGRFASRRISEFDNPTRLFFTRVTGSTVPTPQPAQMAALSTHLDL
jgi:hypothetical protein